MSHPYEAFIHKVQKPGRYVGGEYRSVRKAWDSVRVRAALAFPDAYEIGMSHLGLRILYGILNGDPEILCERAFAPWGDLETELRARAIPLVSIESARPLGDFDCVGFSLQYELTFTNVLNMLDLAGIPLRWKDRDGRHPLIVAGGPAATQPEPLAPFIDCFLIGDGEDLFPEFLRRLARLRDAGLPRPEVLRALSGLEGVYCPALYGTVLDPASGRLVVEPPGPGGPPYPVRRRIVADLARHPFPSVSPVPSTEAIFDRFSLEIARGCTEGCRFCQAGMIYRPVRERRPDEIIDTLLRALRETGYDEASLTSLSTADYSCVGPLVTRLMERMRQEKASLSVSSLRAYGLPDDLLDAIADVRNTSLTFAPEAGTQRMRDVISKNISEEDMERSASAVFSRGWKKVKLYFMIGLPTETGEDVQGIVDAAGRYLQIADRYHRGGIAEVTVSVSSFVPKPHTPFQWARMADIQEIRSTQDLLIGRTRSARRIRLKWHDPEISHIEALMARGDRRMADLIEYAFRGGCRFDGWGDQLRFEIWDRGITELGFDRGAWLREIPVGAGLPWDHIDVGVTREFLAKEYRKALESRLSPPCSKPLASKVRSALLEGEDPGDLQLVCFDCGIGCDLDALRADRAARLKGMGPGPGNGPADPARPPAIEEDLEGIRDRNALPRTRVENRAKIRWRLRFTKLGPQRFISHLDMVRILPRIFRRSGVPLAYSQGFHPKPIMTFSPALGLGWGSRGEILDIVLVDEMESADLLGRLNASTPEGIWFEEAALLGPDDPALPKLIDALDYEIALPPDADLAAIRERLAHIAAGGPVPILRQRDVEAGEVDVAGAIGGAAIRGGPGPQGDGEPYHLFLRISPNSRGPIPRPSDLFGWIVGRVCAPQDICRTGLWRLLDGVAVSPLEIALHHRAPRPPQNTSPGPAGR